MRILLTVKEKGYVTFFIGMIMLLSFYVFFENCKLKKIGEDNHKQEIVHSYHLYKDGIKNRDFNIENPDYYDNSELVEELSKSTPFMVDKDGVTIEKYIMSFKFYPLGTKDKTISKDILSLSVLDKEFQVKFVGKDLTLFGKIKDQGFVKIIKKIDNQEYTQIVDNNRLILIIVVILNVLSFFYFFSLIKNTNQELDFKKEEFEEMKKDVKSLAFTDPLTGVASRLKFDESIKDAISLAERFENQKFSLVLFDIDNFKKVNDTLGHDYGDIVLKEVSKAASEIVRDSDIFARWGGEEFVVLSHFTDIEEGAILAERIRESIENLRFAKLDKVTCSFGVSEFQKNDNEEKIMKRADELLYRAKENGKNRVEKYSS
ncbi:MAG: GGDEF domain-containing protein [Campylobacterales bacterium]|nr:GGDEF domain-containing protein [Campylobacterales bacterium]